MANFERVHYLTEVADRRPTVLAIGVFDGVHRGHQQILQRVVESASALNARPAVLTFFPHPRVVTQGLSGRLYVMDLKARVRQLAAYGIELVVTHPFDEAVRNTTATDFVQQMLDHLDIRQLWGGNFSLGYQRQGDYAFLSQLGQENGFTVHLHDAVVTTGDERISSSRIRRGLQNGNIADVNLCLGHAFSLCGEVVLGKQLGRTIGVPTANLNVWDEQLLPANGVYSTKATVDGTSYLAATNVGMRPTVDDGLKLSVEAHLLDFDGDIYGKNVELFFYDRIRGEKKFDGLEVLKGQISADIVHVRRILSPENGNA